MKKTITILCLTVLANISLAQKVIRLNADPSVSYTEKVTINKFLPSTLGLIIGVEVEKENGETAYIQFKSILAKEMMDAFPIGTKAEVKFRKRARWQMNMMFNTALFRSYYNNVGLPEGGSAYRVLSNDLQVQKEAMKNMSRKELRGFEINELISVKSGNQYVENPKTFEREKTRPKKDELFENITVLSVKKENRFTSTVKTEYGRTLSIKNYIDRKVGDKATFLVQYPWLFEGEVPVSDVFFENASKARVLKGQKMQLSTPLYDNWGRLFAYEAVVDGKEAVVKFEPFHAEQIQAYADEHQGEVHELLTSGKSKRVIKRANKRRVVGISYDISAIPTDEGNVLLNDRFEPYTYQDTVTLKSKIVETEKKTSENFEWLNIYDNRFLLDNGYAFSISERIRKSFKTPLLPGDEIEITGVPYVKKEGEVLEDGVKQMFKPISIKVGNITYSINIR
ncbi:hypothetical protein [Roseivirga misakiensis]|uniref:Uncharacterized protein n=1 Tax=Roseivirga misakiensis TaxID=1563681 RepID=A0A1E5T6W7_9BACT|nr:hypothetical protein [Roseivirga misakiensis]OEK07110.1 hypothetical protein BFP71_05485 [Roseivirga misakiensis]